MNSLYLLAILIFFGQGIGSLAGQPLYYFLRESLHLSVSQIMLIGSLTSLPWLIKPIYGIFSDSISLFGYRRKSYIILSALISTFAFLLIGLLPYYSLPILISLMLFASVGGAGDNVAVNGMGVEEGNQTGKTGNFQSLCWLSLGVGSVLTGVLGGYISERASYHLAYIILAFFPILIALTAIRHEEPKVPSQNKPIKPILMDFLIKLKDKQIFLCSIFLFFLWFSPSFGTPLLDRMRTTLHMSKVWIGWLDTIGASCGILGAIVYYKVNQKINMKHWLYYGTIISTIATFAYLYLTPTSILWYTIVFGASTQYVHLLLLHLMATTCPKGTEATTYALLCSLVNCAAFFSNIVGAKCFSLFGYNGLVIISGVTTFMCLGFIPFLRVNQ